LLGHPLILTGAGCVPAAFASALSFLKRGKQKGQRVLSKAARWPNFKDFWSQPFILATFGTVTELNFKLAKLHRPQKPMEFFISVVSTIVLFSQPKSKIGGLTEFGNGG
jgi:hypothetical protein